MPAQPEEWILTAADGLGLHTRRWRPESPARGAVLIVHGFAEHGGRYAHVAESFNRQGFVVQAFDHRTHGRSGGEPRVYVPDLKQVLGDIALQTGSLREAAPGRPLFVYGHSLGSYFSLAALLDAPDGVAGFVSSASPLDADTTVSPLLLRLAELFGALWPRLPLVPVRLWAISRDPAVVAAYLADPLVHAGRMRAGMCSRLNRELPRLRARLPEFKLPLLVMHGGADRLAPQSGSRRLFEGASSPDKTLRIYPGLYHEVHNEPEQGQVLADVAAWLAARA